MVNPRHSSLVDWLAWQETLHPVGIDLGLDRCRAVMARMGCDRIGGTIVTVAGTNGKGSSVALLESIYSAAGYRVASYTSPHLLRYNERIRLDREPVDDAAICAAFARVDQARGDVSLTYFEFGTLAAFAVFADAAPDVCVLEVGLGGRLDAVNLVDADVALITAIDLDHQDWLGTTRDAIAREKAGIMRSGRPAVCSDHDAPPALSEIAAEIGCPLRRLGVEFHFEANRDDWEWWSSRHRWLELPHPALPGEHQYRNAAGVLQAVSDLADAVPVTAQAIRDGLRTMRLRGRFERLSGDVEYLLDVAHNPAAALILAAALRADAETGNKQGKTFVLFGIMADKDAAGFIAALEDGVDEWHMVTLPGARAARAADLVALRRRTGSGRKSARAHESIAAAHAWVAAQARPGDRVVVTGSHIAVSEFIAARDIAAVPAAATTL